MRLQPAAGSLEPSAETETICREEAEGWFSIKHTDTGSNRPQLVSERKSPIFMKLKRAELHYYYYVNIDVTSWKHVHKLG